MYICVYVYVCVHTYMYLCVCVCLYMCVYIYICVCIYIKKSTWQLSLVSIEVKVAQSCLTRCDPMDCSPPGSSTQGISQARILEWVASSFSGKSARPTEEILPVEIGLLLL